RQLREGHAEKLMRVQHEAELKRLRAEANAKVREAQLKGMAQTAAAARQQAGTLFARNNDAQKNTEGGSGTRNEEKPRVVPPQSPTTGKGELPAPPSARGTTRREDDPVTPFSATPATRSRGRPARGNVPSTTVPGTQEDDLMRRGSLEYVTPPGADLPVDAV